MTGDYRPILAFDSDSPDFVRGFESGWIYATLKLDEERQFVAHWTNAEMMLRVGESLGLEVKARTLDDDWTEYTFS